MRRFTEQYVDDLIAVNDEIIAAMVIDALEKHKDEKFYICLVPLKYEKDKDEPVYFAETYGIETVKDIRSAIIECPEYINDNDVNINYDLYTSIDEVFLELSRLQNDEILIQVYSFEEGNENEYMFLVYGKGDISTLENHKKILDECIVYNPEMDESENPVMIPYIQFYSPVDEE